MPPGNVGPQWNSKLLEDLTFIKKHLRYPFSKRTIPSVFVVLVFLFGLSRIILPLTLSVGRNPTVEVVCISVIILMVILAFYQYYRTLMFAVIPTPFTRNENRALIDKFLRSQQLATYTHPEAPVVLQIVSRALGNSKNEQREVMIFIADDYRILINSHFINLRFTISPQSHNYRQMANRLKEWMRMHYPDMVMIDGKR